MGCSLTNYEIALPKRGDFLVDDQYMLEVGGTRKSQSQLQGLTDAYTVVDDIEIGTAKKIPIWLFVLNELCMMKRRLRRRSRRESRHG